METFWLASHVGVGSMEHLPQWRPPRLCCVARAIWRSWRYCDLPNGSSQRRSLHRETPPGLGQKQKEAFRKFLEFGDQRFFELVKLVKSG